MPKNMMDGLNSFEKVIGALLVVVLFIILLYQTFGRSFGLTATWTDETARYLFVLLVYVGAGLAMLLGKHIKIDIMICIWPKKVRKYMELLGCILGALFCAYVFYQTLQYNITVVFAGGRISPSLGIAMWIPYTAVNIGYFLMLVRLIQVEIIPGVKTLFSKRVPVEGRGAKQ